MALQVGAQLLRQGGQHRHVTAGISFAVGSGVTRRPGEGPRLGCAQTRLRERRLRRES